MRVAQRRRSRPVFRGNRFGRGQDETAGLDSLGADQVIGQVSDLARGAAEQNHFQAAAFVEMDVGGGHDLVEMVVLEIREPGARSGDMW